MSFPGYSTTFKEYKLPKVELIGDVVRQTDKAICFRFTDLDDEEVIRKEWFPLSQVDEIHHETPARIVVSGWIYSQKQKDWG